VKIGEMLRTRAVDILALTSYAAAGTALIANLWRDPDGLILADNQQDEIFFEWMLTHAGRVVTHGESPFFTDALNAPLGVNLMANTSVLGLAIPLSPLTLIFGAAVTFALICTLATAGTAAAWYLVLSRAVTKSRAAAYIGGLFCGFAPAIVSQDTGHPNIAGQYLIPFIVLVVTRLREKEHRIRRGIVLAALVIYQFFINEEILFLTALALLVFILLALPPREWLPSARTALPSIGLAAGIAAVVLAYPLWHQFSGPQAYNGLPDFVFTFSSDLASFKEFSRRSLMALRDPSHVARIDKMGGPTEENTFFGWPLLMFVAASTIILWRNRIARSAFLTGLVFAVLSLGVKIRYEGSETDWQGIWKPFPKLPLFNSVVPTRLALVITPMIGVLLAVLVDKYIAYRKALETEDAEEDREQTDPKPDDLGFPVRLVWSAACFVALVPLIPTPQPATPRDPVPVFYSSGAWRDHFPKGSVVVPVPGGWGEYLEEMRWSTATNQEFKIVGGYFLAPNLADPKRQAAFGPDNPPTNMLMQKVSVEGQVPEITQAERDQARADATRWKATAFVLYDRHGNADVLRQLVDQLFGPGQHVQDVWVWDVRAK
jgi:hypothetical protein